MDVSKEGDVIDDNYDSTGNQVSNDDEDDDVSGIVGLGILGGLGYLFLKKKK